MGVTNINHHCKNGPRLWLKVRNRFAAPQSITFACGDKYERELWPYRHREGHFAYVRVQEPRRLRKRGGR